MASRISELVLDCADPELLARFWCDVLGYVELDREDWARLRDHHPLVLRPEEVSRLSGLVERLDITEIEQVYLPLSRLLSFYVEATSALPEPESSSTPSAVARPSGVIAHST